MDIESSCAHLFFVSNVLFRRLLWVKSSFRAKSDSFLPNCVFNFQLALEPLQFFMLFSSSTDNPVPLMVSTHSCLCFPLLLIMPIIMFDIDSFTKRSKHCRRRFIKLYFKFEICFVLSAKWHLSKTFIHKKHANFTSAPFMTCEGNDNYFFWLRKKGWRESVDLVT